MAYREKIRDQIVENYPQLEPIKVLGDANDLTKPERKLWQLYL